LKQIEKIVNIIQKNILSLISCHYSLFLSIQSGAMISISSYKDAERILEVRGGRSCIMNALDAIFRKLEKLES